MVLFLRLNITEVVSLSKTGHYINIRGSSILMRWSYSLHLGLDTVVFGLDIGNSVGLVPYKYQ